MGYGVVGRFRTGRVLMRTSWGAQLCCTLGREFRGREGLIGAMRHLHKLLVASHEAEWQ